MAFTKEKRVDIKITKWNAKKRDGATHRYRRALREFLDSYASFMAINMDDLDVLFKDLELIGSEYVKNAFDSTEVRHSYGDNGYKGLINAAIYAGDKIRLEVEDNGASVDPRIEPYLSSNRLSVICHDEENIDIPKEALKRNQHLECSDKSGGLGIVIVSKLAVDYGGLWGYENKPGNGAIFWFEMPIERICKPTEMHIATRQPSDITAYQPA